GPRPNQRRAPKRAATPGRGRAGRGRALLPLPPGPSRATGPGGARRGGGGGWAGGAAGAENRGGGGGGGGAGGGGGGGGPGWRGRSEWTGVGDLRGLGGGRRRDEGEEGRVAGCSDERGADELGDEVLRFGGLDEREDDIGEIVAVGYLGEALVEAESHHALQR